MKAMPSVISSRNDAGQPRQLARILVGPEQEHLHHVEQDDRHHEVRSPPVHRAQEPPERLLVVEDEQAGLGLACRRDVDERQADPGHELQHEQHQAGAAEHVRPARRAPRDGVRGGLADRGADLQAMVDPVPTARTARITRMAASRRCRPARAGVPASASSRRGSRACRPQSCSGSGRAPAAADRRPSRRPRSTRRHGRGT